MKPVNCLRCLVLLCAIIRIQGEDLLTPETECSGDLVFDGCHSACPFVCGKEIPALCPTVCHRGCGCRRGFWLTEEDGDTCVQSEEDCPNQILPGGDRDEHNCIHSAGYTWCGGLRQCVRPWETECNCLTALDSNGNCVDVDCSSWFDGCNTCGVDMITGNLVCTEMYCSELDEPRCLVYSSGNIGEEDELTSTDSSSSSNSTSKATFMTTIIAVVIVVSLALGFVTGRLLYRRGLCDERTPLKPSLAPKFKPVVELPSGSRAAKDGNDATLSDQVELA